MGMLAMVLILGGAIILHNPNFHQMETHRLSWALAIAAGATIFTTGLSGTRIRPKNYVASKNLCKTPVFVGYFSIVGHIKFDCCLSISWKLSG